MSAPTPAPPPVFLASRPRRARLASGLARRRPVRASRSSAKGERVTEARVRNQHPRMRLYGEYHQKLLISGDPAPTGPCAGQVGQRICSCLAAELLLVSLGFANVTPRPRHLVGQRARLRRSYRRKWRGADGVAAQASRANRAASAYLRMSIPLGSESRRHRVAHREHYVGISYHGMYMDCVGHHGNKSFLWSHWQRGCESERENSNCQMQRWVGALAYRSAGMEITFAEPANLIWRPYCASVRCWNSHPMICSAVQGRPCRAARTGTLAISAPSGMSELGDGRPQAGCRAAFRRYRPIEVAAQPASAR